ncbi:MAG: 1-phosphofructokinase [Syntrophotaleaceae bacterium]
MVETVTLNPALDRTLWVKSIRPDDSNRILKENRYSGGKGIDVSRVLTSLGIANKALGFVGGFTGDELEGRLLNEGIACDFVRIAGETRTNIIINDADAGKQLIFNAEGPEIQPYELMNLMRKIEDLTQPDLVVISGSLPRMINPEIYRRIIDIAKHKGATVVLDTDGEALKLGIRGKPDIIKPNLHELERLVDRSLETLEDILQAARDVQKRGINTVLVSMGARGMLLISDDTAFKAVPPEVEIVNTIGAGDSSVAGFVYGRVKNLQPDRSLACAVAAGAATVMRPGTALCTAEDFNELLDRVNVEQI